MGNIARRLRKLNPFAARPHGELQDCLDSIAEKHLCGTSIQISSRLLMKRKLDLENEIIYIDYERKRRPPPSLPILVQGGGRLQYGGCTMARGKSISHYCSHCERATKMEPIGQVENQPEKTWYRCTRCRHAVLLDLAELRKHQESSKRKIDKAECLEYRPQDTYQVGQAIFHSQWDDIGKVISKEKTSGGASAIVVSFERLGERRLLENIVNNSDSQE
jgi:DNA-directed RNA polymerase subunit RPC12/RpoP